LTAHLIGTSTTTKQTGLSKNTRSVESSQSLTYWRPTHTLSLKEDPPENMVSTPADNKDTINMKYVAPAQVLDNNMCAKKSFLLAIKQKIACD
jgi:hypothetical protein